MLRHGILLLPCTAGHARQCRQTLPLLTIEIHIATHLLPRLHRGDLHIHPDRFRLPGEPAKLRRFHRKGYAQAGLRKMWHAQQLQTGIQQRRGQQCQGLLNRLQSAG